MNGLIRYILFFCAAGIVLFSCSGGGADISNPLVGKVSLETGNRKAVAGARVVIGRQGVDPGFEGYGWSSSDCAMRLDSGLCMLEDDGDARYFDTTWTDETGYFTFERIEPGEYTIVATFQQYQAITYITKNLDETGWAPMKLTEPAVVKLAMHDAVDTTRDLHFAAMRVAGTDIVGTADAQGEVTLVNAPEGNLELILYASDSSIVRFPSLWTRSAQTTVLVAQPGLAPDRWVPQNSGSWSPTDRPYIVSTYFPAESTENASRLDVGKEFDIRVQFSDNMDALATAQAVTAVSENDSATVERLWWEGGNVLYISLCVPAPDGSCNGFEQGRQYGVAIDTTARNVQGISFGYRELLMFTPVP